MHNKMYFQMLMKNIEKKADGTISVSGYASTSDTDRYNDRVLPTAFTDTMPVYMGNPVMLLQHDAMKLIGSFDQYAIDTRGLKVYGTVKYDIDDCMKKIEQGDLAAFSIGFIVKSYEFRDKNWNLIATEDGIMPGFDWNDCYDKDTLRIITKLDLVEISAVTTPANPFALFQVAKKFFKEELKSIKSLQLKAAAEDKDDDENEDELCPECEKPMEECTCHKEAPKDAEKDTPTPEKKETEEEAPPPPEVKPEEPKEEEKTIEQPEEDPTKQSTTGEEDDGGATPPPPETEDVPGEDNSEPVKAGEETPEAPKSITAEEVKSLIDAALAAQKEAFDGEIKTLKEALITAVGTIETFTKAFETHLGEFKALEKDILSIEVRPGKQQSKSARWPVVMTDAMVLKSIGM